MDPPDPLTPEHRRTLERGSGIAPEVIAARGYRTVTVKAQLRRLGFAESQARVPALLIPIWGVGGEIVLYQARPDQPRIVAGKAVKYETPRGVRMVLDLPPTVRHLLGNPSVPLFITEGIKKADALASRGACVIALLGVWNWRGTNERGGKTVLADWEQVALNGRQIYIAFDSDVMTKPEVHAALARLKGFLEARRARVALVYLPSGPGAAKVGVDDYLASGHSLDDLLALAALDVRPVEREVSTQSRPQIVVAERFLREIADDAWKAVTTNTQPSSLFQRGRLVVDIAADDREVPGLRTLDAPAFKGVLDRVADFVRPDEHGDLVPARPPSDVVADMMAGKEKPLPVLEGITRAPTFVPPGVLVSAPGYHAGARLYLAPARGLHVPLVPERPDAAAIARAVRLLTEELLGDFPFAEDADRVHAVAALLLPFGRLMVEGPTPLHLVESPTPGTGKGLLVDILAIPASGHGPAVMTEGRDEDEWRKRITAKLLAAPQFILIDNIRSRLDSAALSAALTSEVWEDRVLGYSRTAQIPVTCVWLGTANNPRLSLEVARRDLPIRVDAGEERPWLRSGFRHPNLRGWAKAHRGDLVWAALVLWQAWIAAGRPKGDRVLGSYEVYAEVMGGVLEVAGISSFLGNLDRAYAGADQEVAAWAAFLAAWHEEFADRPVAADLLFGLATRERLLSHIWAGRQDHGARTAFGKALAAMRDRVIGDFRVRRAGEAAHDKVARWRLERTLTRAAAGVAGDRGGSSGAAFEEARPTSEQGDGTTWTGTGRAPLAEGPEKPPQTPASPATDGRYREEL